jgi:hypothetical protein
MKASKFFLDMANKNHHIDVSVKHQLFPEFVQEVYGRENPSGYINSESEKQIDKLIMQRYFFRYWLSGRIDPNVYTGKDVIISKKVPYEALLEDYMAEVNANLPKPAVFSLLHSREKPTIEIDEYYGSSSAYECVIIEK